MRILPPRSIFPSAAGHFAWHLSIRTGVVPALTLCAIVLMASTPIPAAEKKTPSELPWSLRDHYTFSKDRTKLTYGVDNGEWLIDVEGVGTVFKEARATVTFADGSVFEATQASTGEGFRDWVHMPIGSGIEYGVNFGVREGLEVKHSISSLEEYPFHLMRLRVVNRGEAPVEVARISPIVVGPGGLSGFSPDVRVSTRRLRMRGSTPVYTADGRVTVMFIEDPVHDFTLFMSGLPVEAARTVIDLQGHAGTWQGEVATVFDPPVVVAPGEELASAPIVLCFREPDPVLVDMYQGWMRSRASGKPVAVSGEQPRFWATAPEGEPADELAKATRDWWALGVTHALVPMGWEVLPGTMRGVEPKYPKDMARLSSIIKRAEMTPGLSLDPLAVQKGAETWSAESADGQRWLNPATGEGFAEGAARVRAAMNMGYEFVAVPESAIPDAVLRQFGLTRAAADALAFDMARRGAAGLPVVATAVSSLGPEPGDWLKAAGDTARMVLYGLDVGPVRFDLDDVDKLSDETVAAMALYQGPIEFAGEPKQAVCGQLARVLMYTNARGWPLDPSNRAPKLWRLLCRDAEGNEDTAVVAFSGARAWDVQEAEAGNAAHVWRHQDGKVTEVKGSEVPPSESYAVYTFSSELTRPAVLNPSIGPALMPHEVQDVRWDGQRKILSGLFVPTAGNRAPATAHVAKPDGWKIEGGRVGGERIRAKDQGNLLAFDLDLRESKPFEFEFERE